MACRIDFYKGLPRAFPGPSQARSCLQVLISPHTPDTNLILLTGCPGLLVDLSFTSALLPHTEVTCRRLGTRRLPTSQLLQAIYTASLPQDDSHLRDSDATSLPAGAVRHVCNLSSSAVLPSVTGSHETPVSRPPVGARLGNVRTRTDGPSDDGNGMACGVPPLHA